MGSYDKVNELKAKYAMEIAEKDKRIEELLQDKKELKEQLKQLKTERYADKRGQGEVDRLNAELKKAQQRIAQLEAREKSKESYSCFSHERQVLISKINGLKSPSSREDDLFYKFQNGASEALIIAKKIKLDTLLVRDCYVHVFRDDLMSLFEKTLQVILNKPHTTLFWMLKHLRDKDMKLDKEYTDAVPLLKNRKIFGHMLSVVYMENTAYHGTTTGKKAIAPGSEEEEDDVTSFFELTQETKLNTIFAILELLYYVFTNGKSEQNLLLIASQWN